MASHTAAAPENSIAIHVTADAYADTLVRIANVILLANAPPSRVSLQTDGDEVHLEIELRDIEASVVDRIRRKLMQLTCVTALELRYAADAAPRRCSRCAGG